MTLLTEFDCEIEADHKEVAQKVVGFYSDLVRVSPVDTGEFKGAWSMKINDKWSWTIKNNMKDYAETLARGYRVINGKSYGSKQWADGIFPMIENFKESLK